ncbi:DUF6348 family protein [Streptomyces sp. SAS_260]|uniref:DUF6348 family protein n=1 Tax=Streptomyces sp. SAS_260 TaxID=3412751 RepID=UPI00403CC4FE
MSWIRRHKRKEEPSAKRLPDLEFLALVKTGLEEIAPGVTQGAQLKGNSLISPQGWAVAVAPPHHGGGHHYDLVALPDVSLQPDVPCFMDCVVSMSADPQDAANTWVQTAGVCLLELLDRRAHFADHTDPDDERGVPGWHTITSGAVGLGSDVDENRRLQRAARSERAPPGRGLVHSRPGIALLQWRQGFLRWSPRRDAGRDPCQR